MSIQILTQAHLKELLDYDAGTGVFVWRVYRGGKAVAGSVAGSKDTSGYPQILIHRHPYRAHRLAWLYMTGAWPREHIDHINGVRDDNRWCNLRDVSHALNTENKRKGESTRGGLIGATYRPRRVKWEARITVRGKPLSIGHYSTELEAHQAYVTAKRSLHEGCTI